MTCVRFKTRRAATRCVLGAIVALLLFTLPLFSQTNFGRILGTVTDQSGAIIAGAQVNVIDTERGLARTLTSDDAGEYNAPNLTPGTYIVRVEAKGFKVLERQNVPVEVGREVRVDLTPQPGEQTQTVTVSEAIPLVDSTSATLGGTLSNTEINDMPLNGRNYQNLLSLRPGVVAQPGGGPWTTSTNNVRPDESGWMVDGVINVNFYDARPVVNMPSPLTDGATILPIDAIQEFNLAENPKSEYGWKPGAVVNVGIRSGTNTLHGAAYAFGRDGAWGARNLFNPAPNPAPPVELKQYGGVVGGAIKKDKLFFFGGYEALRSTVGNVILMSTPEIAGQPTPDPKRSMVDAIKALQTAGVTPSPISLKLLGCTTGPVACTGGLIDGASPNTTNHTSTYPNVNSSDNFVGKVDYNISNKHRLNGVLVTGGYTADGMDHPFVNQIFLDTYKIRAWTAIGNWIWIPSSRVVNDARFGYNSAGLNTIPDDVNTLADGKGYPLNTGVTLSGGLPNLNITGFQSIGTWHNRPNVWSTPYYDFQDSVSYLRGKHALKFGGEFTHIVVNSTNGDTSRGRIDFQGGNTSQIPKSTPLEDFFAGNPSRGFLLVGDPTRRITWGNIAGFVQDDWHVTPKLMVNMGLRYSYVSPMKEDHNLFGNFDPKLGLVQQGQQGDTLWQPDRKNFSPRLGFAWDVSGKGTTIVRAGASVIYSTLTAATFLQQNGLQNTTSTSLAAVPTGGCTTAVTVGAPCPTTFGGTIQLGSQSIPGSNLDWNGVVFPKGAGISCTKSGPCNIMAVDQNLKSPYITNWNVGVQHAFGSNLSLEVGYVGNHGERLTGIRDINQIDPTTGVRPYAASFPYLKFINQHSNDARSNFHSLQTTLSKRLSHGVSFTAGYTYGHGLDNGSLNRAGGLPQDSRHPEAEYASGDFDIRHRFTLTTSYDLPGRKGFGQLLEGWKINGILSLQTGQPWIANDLANDFSGSGDMTDRWNFYGNPADFKSGSSSIPYCTGPGAGGCSVNSGISSIQTNFSAAASAAMWAQCTAVAPDPSTLNAIGGGCFVSGKSVMVPPKSGTFGTMGRNMFRDSGFQNLDFSVFKNFTLKERLHAQFRAEFFNILNHPMVANPYGSANGWGVGNDPGNNPNQFGCGCATPDVTAGNPYLGSGGPRVIQLGLKLIF
jgi:hypothetical protein